jgi:hypothetical protein
VPLVCRPPERGCVAEAARREVRVSANPSSLLSLAAAGDGQRGAVGVANQVGSRRSVRLVVGAHHAISVDLCGSLPCRVLGDGVHVTRQSIPSPDSCARVYALSAACTSAGVGRKSADDGQRAGVNVQMLMGRRPVRVGCCRGRQNTGTASLGIEFDGAIGAGSPLSTSSLDVVTQRWISALQGRGPSLLVRGTHQKSSTCSGSERSTCPSATLPSRNRKA